MKDGSGGGFGSAQKPSPWIFRSELRSTSLFSNTVPQFPLTQTVWLCYCGTGLVGIVFANSWVLVVLW